MSRSVRCRVVMIYIKSEHIILYDQSENKIFGPFIDVIAINVGDKRRGRRKRERMRVPTSIVVPSLAVCCDGTNSTI